MRDLSGIQALRAVVASVAVIAAGCGSQSASPTGPSEGLSAPRIALWPAGAIVGTSVVLQSNIPKVPWHYGSDPSGGYQSFSWDFGDGTTLTGGGESMSHVYRSEGSFFATVTASSSDSGAQQATARIQVGSLTGLWSGDYGRVSITQDGLRLRGRSLDDPREGTVEGAISESGTVTFTVTRPGLEPLTFNGMAGPDVMTLEGTAKGRGAVDRPWKLTRG